MEQTSEEKHLAEVIESYVSPLREQLSRVKTEIEALKQANLISVQAVVSSRYSFLDKMLIERKDMVSKLYMESKSDAKDRMLEAIKSLDKTITEWRKE